MASVFCPSTPDAFPAISFGFSPEESIADSTWRDAEQDAAQAVAVIRRIEEANEHQTNATVDGLERLSIDELRRLACDLRVTDRAQITEKTSLIAEIRRRM
jgi:hypothetical protein